MPGGRNWTPDEDEKLAELYPADPWPVILAAFPGRTRNGIRMHAIEKGIRRDRTVNREPRPVDAIVRDLVALRQAKHLKQYAFAMEAGFSQAQLSLWELGKAEPTLTNLHKWAAALGYRISLDFASAPVRARPSFSKQRDERWTVAP